MMTISDEMIDETIRNCYYAEDIGSGAIVCRLYALPCGKVIDSGRCDSLIELFKKEGKHEEDSE